MHTLHVGTLTYPLFGDKTNIVYPSIHIKNETETCYAYLEPNRASNSLNLSFNNKIYHAVDPTATTNQNE